MEQFITTIVSVSTISFVWICVKSLIENLTSTDIENKLTSLTERLKKRMFSNLLVAIFLASIVLIFNFESIERQIAKNILEIGLEMQWTLYILSIIFISYVFIYLINMINFFVDYILSIKPEYFLFIEDEEWQFIKTTESNKYLLANSSNELLIVNSLDDKIITPRFKMKAHLNFIYRKNFIYFISLILILAIAGLIIFLKVNNLYIKYLSLFAFILAAFSLINLIGNKLLLKYKGIFN